MNDGNFWCTIGMHSFPAVWLDAGCEGMESE